MSGTVDFDARVDAYRGELIGYCYRYFGSYAEAEVTDESPLLASST